MANEEASDPGGKTAPAGAQCRNENPRESAERQALARRMGEIKHKIIVLSGKGGVGKSTVAVNLALSLSLAGKRVGLLDVDIHGPSIPKLLGLENRSITVAQDNIIPLAINDNLKVLSIGFLLPNREEAVIWRGPMKAGIIKQFLKDVEWGKLDYLVIDCPPGTGDEPLSVCQLLDNAAGAVVVTTPQEIALADVRKSITFCRHLKLPVLGVVENMSGFVCPKCGELTDVFGSGGGEKMAQEMEIKFLGRIPIEPLVVKACDEGKPYIYHHPHTETAKAFARVIRPILAMDKISTEPISEVEGAANAGSGFEKKEKIMRIAIPIAGGKLAMHFGHCEEFALLDVEQETKAIVKQESVPSPEHEPGLLPRWLAERGADMIIAGGMGSRAQSLFAKNKIKVVIGAPAETPEAIVTAYLNGKLETGDNVCDH